MAVVAKSPADGYTLGMGGIGPNAINPAVFANTPYDTLRDFAPITFVASNVNVLVVHPSVPARNVQELVAYAKANPGKLSFRSAGAGTPPPNRGARVQTPPRAPVGPPAPHGRG